MRIRNIFWGMMAVLGGVFGGLALSAGLRYYIGMKRLNKYEQKER